MPLPASNDDERNLFILRYYGPRTLPDRKLRYVPTKSWRKGAAQWLIMHRLDNTALPPPKTELSDEFGNTWKQVTVFRHAPLSGMDWYVYLNSNFP